MTNNLNLYLGQIPTMPSILEAWKRGCATVSELKKNCQSFTDVGGCICLKSERKRNTWQPPKDHSHKKKPREEFCEVVN